MLKFFRKKAVTKFVLWLLLLLILPAFVMWGTANISRKGPRYVGIVHGKKVSFDDLSGSLTAIRCQLIMNYWNQDRILKEVLNDRRLLAKLAWERLITLREAQIKKVRVTNAEVIDYIRSHPLFLRNKIFDEKVYAYILQYNMGLSPRTFEEVTRENLMLSKLRQNVARDVKVSDEEVLDAFKVRSERAKVKYCLIEATGYGKDAFARASETAKKFADLMQAEKDTFEGACAKLGLKPGETGLFSRDEAIEGLGESKALWEASFALGEGKVSGPIEVKGGAVIIMPVTLQRFDRKTFDEKKAEFEKIALQQKSVWTLNRWLNSLTSQATLNIDLDNIDKYYERG